MMHKTTLTSLALLAACGGAAFGQVSTWYYGGGNDTIGNYGQTADSSQAITWNDSWAEGGAQQDNNYLDSERLQVNLEVTLQTTSEAAVALLGFSGISTNPADITSAILYIQPTSVFGSNTFFIGGVPAAESNWDTAEMSFNDYATGTSWSGGNLVDTVFGNYGSFSAADGITDPIAIDLTDALVAYLNGEIGGIAFYNDAVGDFSVPGNEAIIFGSNESTVDAERPGLLVEAVPEASTALFLLFGGFLMLIRRRRG
ncbi:MAG TPA: hypothetical protein VJ952_05265 [Opitutales bacterium]|nr:hypothetical protein [Opitutales bacterium]